MSTENKLPENIREITYKEREDLRQKLALCENKYLQQQQTIKELLEGLEKIKKIVQDTKAGYDLFLEIDSLLNKYKQP